MTNQPTEQELEEWGKPIVDSINGFTHCDLEPLFERYILPFYYLVCTFPEGYEHKSKWKVTNRETGEEYDRVLAQKLVRELRNEVN
jgi:hypothetical protein